MPSTNLLPWILAAMVASVAAMVTGITSGLPALSWLAALLFATALIATAIDVNAAWWATDASPVPDAAIHSAILNGRILALGYVWGSVALYCVYRLTHLRWQHGLQYGAGMALVAWLILLYVHMLSQPGSRLREPRAIAQAAWLSMIHGAGAVVGLGFLIGSGKLFSLRGDWGANLVFLAGGIAVLGISFISAITFQRLRQAERTMAQPPMPAGPA